MFSCIMPCRDGPTVTMSFVCSRSLSLFFSNTLPCCGDRDLESWLSYSLIVYRKDDTASPPFESPRLLAKYGFGLSVLFFPIKLISPDNRLVRFFEFKFLLLSWRRIFSNSLRSLDPLTDVSGEFRTLSSLLFGTPPPASSSWSNSPV